MKKIGFNFQSLGRLIACICVLSSSVGYAQQQEADSLLRVLRKEKDDTNKALTLNQLASVLQNTVPDSTILLAQQALAIATKCNWKVGIAYAYKNEGLGYWIKGDFDRAIDFDTKALEIANETGNKRMQSTAYCNLAIVYNIQAAYPKALDNYLKALKIDEELGDKQGQTTDLGGVGQVYFNQGDLTKALDYFQKGLKLAQETGSEEDVAMEYSNIGNVYENQKTFTQALEYYQKALDIAGKIGNKQGQAIIMCSMGDIYAYQGNNDKALDCYRKSMDMEIEMGDKRGESINVGNIGTVYIKMGKFKDAEEYLKKDIVMDSSIGEMDYLMQIEQAMSQLYDTTGRYKLALTWYRKAMVLKDTLFNKEKNRALTKNELTYQYEKKEAATKAEQDKKDAQQRILTFSILGGLLLVLVFAGFIFRSLRITRKQKTLIEEQKALVDEKNKDILDSITYAKRLQDAILPPLNTIKGHLPESFVLYKPKDIVAGDFYWIASPPSEGGGKEHTLSIPPLEGQREAILIAAADCTGHGVPGALVSVVCSNALNRTVKEFKITEPGKILDKVRELVLETFEKSVDNVQDGMDISLAAISHQPLAISWSGAYNSLWYVQDGEMHEVAADKQPIGKTDNPKLFTTHTIKLNPPLEGREAGTVLYLLTDGYADQFGGAKGKKFKYKQLQEKLLAISHQSMAEQKQILETTLDEWKGNLEQVDDILIIGIRV